jgi:DNA-binding helix-hairpin-helix protein with protein kinase domain
VTRVVGKDSGTTFHLDPTAVLGRGVEGTVYRVDDAAVKVYATPLSAVAAAKIDTLIRFARRVPGFAWPTELVHDTTAAKTTVGFIMPLATGESLEALMNDRRTNTLPTKRKVATAASIVAAVAAAHTTPNLTVYLGDVLKAANVVIADGTATLVDAASVSLLGFRGPDGRLIDAVEPLATPGYVPPEVLANPTAKPSQAADLFALAVVLFELIHGRPPTEPRPCAAAVGLEPDDAVRQGLFVKYLTHPEFTTPTYDPVAVPAHIDDLFRAAFLGPPHHRPTAADWANGLAAWSAALTPPATVPLLRPRRTWASVAAAVGPRADRAAVITLAVASVAFVARWVVVDGPAAVDRTKAWLFPAPARPDPIPAKPVGPALFQELFE